MFRAFVFIFLLSISSLFASQKAIVKSRKAIIYADTTGKSPLGFIRGGKIIKVGDKVRGQGRFLPLVLKKRIVYIKIDDVFLETEIDEAKAQRKDYPEIVTKLEEMTEDGYHFSAQAGQRVITNKWATEGDNTSDVTLQDAVFANVLVFTVTRRKKAVDEWGLGYKYLTAKYKQNELVASEVFVQYSRRIFAMERSRVSADGNLSYGLSGEISTGDGVSSETYISASGGLTYRYLFSDSWDIKVSASYTHSTPKLDVSGFEGSAGLSFIF